MIRVRVGDFRIGEEERVVKLAFKRTVGYYGERLH